jgi:uncharacterized RDD family membrane protein YckC
VHYAIQVEYAGLWRRFAAALIDGSLLAIVGAILRATLSTTAYFVVDTVIGWLYFAAMERSARQATLGKRALGIVATDLGGRRISFPRATGRYFAKIISAVILFIGYLMQPFTEKRQALHDLIAGTLAIKT